MAPDPSSPSFADVLRRLRERAGLTQEELAERAALTAHAVSALERGAPGFVLTRDDAWDDAVDEGRALEVDDAVRSVLSGSARALRLAT